VDVRKALGVQGPGHEELALGLLGVVLDAVVVIARAVGEEAVAHHLGHQRIDEPAELGRAAVRDQGQADHFELLGNAFHRRVRKLYHTLAREESGCFFVVDAAPLPETIEEEIWHEVVCRFR
jgi:hypothetical protein